MFDFPPTVPDLAEVPEIYHPLYEEAGDGFVLEPGLAEKLDTTGLVSALEKERSTGQSALRELKLWRQLGDDPGRVLASTQELEAKAGAAAALIDRLRAENHDYLVTAAATEALLAAGGGPELLMPHIRAAVRVEEGGGTPELRIVGPDGDDRRQGEDGYMTVADLVAEMRASAVFARAFDPVGNRGSGMDPASRPASAETGAARNIRLEDIATGKVVVAV